jgi:hypothetical protein
MYYGNEAMMPKQLLEAIKAVAKQHRSRSAGAKR